MTSEDKPHFYGRRQGRRLRKAKSALMETFLPQVKLDPKNPLDFAPSAFETCLEIGFTMLYNSDIVLSASFLLEQKSFNVFSKCLIVSLEESIDLNWFSTSCLNPV